MARHLSFRSGNPALNKNSFVDTLVPYWEGPIILSGSHKGFGYLEMTGY